MKIRAVIFREVRRVCTKFIMRFFGIFRYIFDNKILLICISFSFGIVLGFKEMNFLFVFLAVIILVGCLLLWNMAFHGRRIPESRRKLIICIAVLSGLGLATIRLMYLTNIEKEMYEEVEKFLDKNVEAAGFASREPEAGNSGMKYVFKLSEIEGERVESRQKLKNLQVIVSYSSLQKIEYGQVCTISGVLEKPGVIENFNYGDYLKTKGIYFTIRYPEIFCTQENQGNIIFRKIYQFKNSLISLIAKKMPEPQSSLLIGLILGEKRQFTEMFEQNQRRAGVLHVVAASGYNVSFVILAGNTVFFLINYKKRIILLLILIWLYCVIAGLSASIVRATIMASFVLTAQIFGSKASVHLTLVYGITVFVLVNPYVIYDIGFQLSIVATIGLVYLLPVISDMIKLESFEKNATFKYFKQYIELGLASFACTVMTLPISIASFGTISILSVITNVLVLPVIETSMLLGVIGILIDFIFTPVARFIFLVVWVQLKYFEIIVNFIGNLEYSAVDFSCPGFILFMFYLIIFIFIIYFYPEKGIEDAGYYFTKIN